MQHIPTRRETEIHTTQVFSDVLPFSLLCELTITCVPSMNNSFTIYYLTSVNIKRPLVTRGYSFDFDNERLIEAFLCFPTRHFKIVSFYPFTLIFPFSNFHAKILLSLVTAICCKLCRKHPGPGCSTTYFTIQPSVWRKPANCVNYWIMIALSTFWIALCKEMWAGEKMRGGGVAGESQGIPVVALVRDHSDTGFWHCGRLFAQ